MRLALYKCQYFGETKLAIKELMLLVERILLLENIGKQLKLAQLASLQIMLSIIQQAFKEFKDYFSLIPYRQPTQSVNEMAALKKLADMLSLYLDYLKDSDLAGSLIAAAENFTEFNSAIHIRLEVFAKEEQEKSSKPPLANRKRKTAVQKDPDSSPHRKKDQQSATVSDKPMGNLPKRTVTLHDDACGEHKDSFYSSAVTLPQAETHPAGVNTLLSASRTFWPLPTSAAVSSKDDSFDWLSYLNTTGSDPMCGAQPPGIPHQQTSLPSTFLPTDIAAKSDGSVINSHPPAEEVILQAE